MRLLGIIAEYNPFHNGHAHHFHISKEISRASHTMAIMSGSFLQRGEPALVDKWTRAKMAVQNGIDLVIELPFVYSCQSAEIFAYGGIQLANATGIMDVLSFGCEDDNLEKLLPIAKLLAEEPTEYREFLKTYLSEGISYPKAREFAVGKTLQLTNSMISTPNNILAIEYLKWLYLTQSTISPLTIKRIHTGYHDEKVVGGFAGATFIRNQIKSSKDAKSIYGLLPDSSYEQLGEYTKENTFAFLDDYFPMILGDLLKASPEKLKEIFDVSEGLENRIAKAAFRSNNMEELISNILSKRYTNTRIKRILVNFLLDHDKKSTYKLFKNPDFKPYLRVLAFNEKGKEILKEIKKHSDVKIISNVSKDYNKLDPLQRYSLDKDILSTNYFYLIANVSQLNKDYVKKPEIV